MLKALEAEAFASAFVWEQPPDVFAHCISVCNDTGAVGIYSPLC